MANNDKGVFDAPIPGESLTSNPETPMPWDRPPKFVDPSKALGHIAGGLLRKEGLSQFSKLMRDGIPITVLAKVTVFSGFMQGLYTTDVSLLLYEPVAVLFVKLAEKLGIDPVLYPGESEDMDIEDEIDYFSKANQEMPTEVSNDEMSLLGGM